MTGTNKKEIEELNQIDLIDYLKKTDRANFRERRNGTLVYKKNESIVIWNNHSYDFGTTVHPYKDVIGTLRKIYDYDFMQTINKLRDFQNGQTTDDPEIPKSNLDDLANKHWMDMTKEEKRRFLES